MSFARKYRKKLLDTGLDTLKSAFKKLGHKSAEATGEFIGNKIADKIVKPKHVIDENSRRKKRKNIKRITTSIIRMEHYKISKLLNNSTVSKFVTKKMDRNK